jgi:uncharacterized protein (DUF1015 family)
VADYSAVICPPYDVISTADRAVLVARHPANAVHVELPASYDDAHRLFEAWQADGTLRRDDRALIYVYEQRYRLADGRLRTARGFLCRLRLEPTGPGSDVRAHEHTMSAPKEDRFRLLSAVRANLSPVILLYRAGPDLPAGELLTALTVAAPDVEAVDDAGVSHRLWLVDPAISAPAATLLAGVARLPLTIADGHHRYQTALRFCAEVGGAGADEVLVLLFEASSGGLSVLATHRLVRATAGNVLEQAAALFDVTTGLGAVAAVPTEPGEIGEWTKTGGARLRRRQRAPAQSPVSELDVSVLADALPRLVGADVDGLTAAGRITYTQDAGAAVAAVDAGEADAAFLLAPTPISSVIEIAAAGDVMPPKSTFFFPKAATGLVFNPLAAP